jgi:DNA-binding NarL/FixJ family response regulator
VKLQEVNKQTTEEKVQEMSTKMQLEWRRRQVFELNSDGQSQTEISRILQMSPQSAGIWIT